MNYKMDNGDMFKCINALTAIEYDDEHGKISGTELECEMKHCKDFECDFTVNFKIYFF